MRVVGIIQARMGSSRLPGKSLMNLNGRPLLDHVVERVKATPGIADFCLATSLADRDGSLAYVAASNQIKLFRGSEWDVLERMRDAARWSAADIIVRVTGDCPLFAPDVAETVVGRFLNGTFVEYAWNDTRRSGYPDGTDVEVFTRDILERAAEQANELADREHVTPWIREHCSSMATVEFSGANLSRLKLSVDRQADFDLVKNVYRELKPNRLTLKDTIEALKAANRRIVQ